jgi:LPXTG-site transpeptidase (sortase) family protein
MSDEDDQPATREEIKEQQNTAANLVRTKLDKLYADEPDAEEEITEVESLPKSSMSKHQLYMQELSSSKRSLAEIQAAWHKYYDGLPDHEKHEVWQEHEQALVAAKAASYEPGVMSQGKEAEVLTEKVAKAANQESRIKNQGKTEAPSEPIYGHNYTVARKKRSKPMMDVKQQLLDNVQKRAKLPKNHHIRSLIFGLSMGTLSVLILLFSFFNERFIVPFIRPSHNVSASPIIVDPNNTGAVGPEAKIIIPKINVEAPVVYDEPSIEEKPVQKALERGVVHYATTPNPGEKGNGVIFGHSSSNILNKGKYKFAFILLKSLGEGDTFIVQKDSKRYVYKVYRKFVTDPADVSVLGTTDKPSTMTLITCDPPGTSTHRLIIIGEQIFPDPGGNKASSVRSDATKTDKIPSNSPSLWQRIKDWF